MLFRASLGKLKNTEEIDAMTRTRLITISLIVLLILAATIHQLRMLPFATQQVVAAAVGMLVGLAILGLACWDFPTLRKEVINGAGYPGFGPVSVAALLGSYWAFTITMAG
jgi:hypothetical protein